MNVGDPAISPEGVSTNKYKSEEVERGTGSQMSRSTDEAE
jgi:hypothetical protein